MSFHSLLTRRNHSYDPLYSRRQYDTIINQRRCFIPWCAHRVSSLPQINAATCQGGPTIVRDIGYDNSPRHFIGSDSRRSLINTCEIYPACPHHNPTMSEKVRVNKHHRDLKRKMVFDLHKEIQKPIHTFVLEEISDIDRITEICMETLRSMMTSRVHRKFLHHVNNNNATVTQHELSDCMDSTNNQSGAYQQAKQENSPLHQESSTEGFRGLSGFVCEGRQYCFLDAKGRKSYRITHDRTLNHIPDKHVSTRPRVDTPIDLTHLSQETRDRRRERAEELLALKKLQLKSPTEAQLHSLNFNSKEKIPTATFHKDFAHPQPHPQPQPQPQPHPNQKETYKPFHPEHESGPSTPRMGSIYSSIIVKDTTKFRASEYRASVQGMMVKRPDDFPTARKSMMGSLHSKDSMSLRPRPRPSVMSPADILECKYLRLNDNQVTFLEEMVRATGKDPGIHPHSKVDVLKVFEMTQLPRQPAPVPGKTRGNAVLFDLDEDEDYEDDAFDLLDIRTSL